MQNLFWVTLRRLFYHDTKMLEMIDNRYRKMDVDISYNDTTNKPQVNGTTLTGNKTSDDLSLQSKTQFTTLPNASAELVGKIYQYIGEDTQTYKNGYFYKCISEEDELGTVTYKWADSVGKAVTSLEELTDTDFDSPTDGQALLFNGEEWVNGNLPTQTTTLEALTDTDIDEPATGEVLKFDGTSWVNGSLPTPSTTLEALTDTDITTPTDGEILRFNGTDWENADETQENQTISLADFEQLTPEEKNNGTAYFIPDANTEDKFIAYTGFTPVGTVISYYGETAPAHYLICDGTEYKKSDYPELWAHLSSLTDTTPYVVSGDNTKFKVPDLRGEFLRGTGTNSHTDQGSGGAVGEHQDGTDIPYAKLFASVNVMQIRETVSNADVIKTASGNFYNFGSNFSGTDSGELSFTSRPTNTSVLYCIAYHNIYIEAKQSYTLEEQEIGTWIDGKKLYQRTYTGSFALPSGDTWVNTGIDAPANGKIKRLVNCVYNANASSQDVPCVCAFLDGKIKLLNVRNSVYETATNEFTIQYTKTEEE